MGRASTEPKQLVSQRSVHLAGSSGAGRRPFREGEFAVKKLIVRLALAGSSIAALLLAGGAGKGLR